MHDAVNRRVFRWTDIRPEVRLRLLFCRYRKASLGGQTEATFIEHLNALNDARFSDVLMAHEAILMIDDNLSSARAEAACRNLGMSPDWFILKRVVLDQRILEHRNALAHGGRRLRSGDLIDFGSADLRDAVTETNALSVKLELSFKTQFSRDAF